MKLSQSKIVKEQSAAIQILANKSILSPQVIKQHFQQVVTSKDRAQV
jgi:hypothetical protein